jgi:hypothetical protein
MRRGTSHERKRELCQQSKGITEEFKVPLPAFCIVEFLHPAVQDSFWFLKVMDLLDAQAVRKTAAIRNAAKISNKFSLPFSPTPRAGQLDLFWDLRNGYAKPLAKSIQCKAF